MSASRIDDIKANLDFALDSNRELVGLISEAQEQDGDVRHIGQKAGAILSAVRECYDYCVSDLKDDFIQNDRRNVYFPFTTHHLKSGQPLQQLTQSKPTVYSLLQSIAQRIKSGKMVEGTISKYSDLLALNKMVNSKKHDRVAAICEEKDAVTRIEFANGATMTASCICPMKDDGTVDFSKPTAPAGASSWTAPSGGQVMAVKDFCFDSPDVDKSRTDVTGFCIAVIAATRFVLGEIYHCAYGVSEDTFKE